MCPICKSLQNSTIGIPKVSSKAQNLIKHNYKIVICNNCGTYFIHPQIDLSSDGWKILYDEEYFPKMSKWYEKNREKDRISRFNKLEKFSPKREMNFLDVGCGEGYSLLEAERRGWNPYGIDITDHRIEEAKKGCIKFSQSNLIEVNFQPNFFDLIYMDSVLEHVLNPLEYLREIKRILKKDGVVYIGIPNEDSLLNDVRRLYFKIQTNNVSPKLKPFETPYHVVGFNQKSIMFALNSAQLKITEIRNFACRLEFLRAKPFSKTFFQSFLLLPIYLLAIPFRKEAYLEVYAQNN